MNATCTAAVENLCGASRRDDRQACFACYRKHKPEIVRSCGGDATHAAREALSQFILAWCPAEGPLTPWPTPLPTECNETMERLCPVGSFNDPKGCTQCVAHAIELVGSKGGVCSTNRSYITQINSTWCEHSGRQRKTATGVPSLGLIEHSIGGTWFSTVAASRCAAGQLPSKRPG